MADLPLLVDQTIYQGATWRAAYRWLPGGVPQDFSGWAAHMQARSGYASLTVLDLTSDTDGGITLDAEGNIALYAPADVTGALPTGLFPTRLRYDLTLSSPEGGDVFRFLQGALTLVPAVTREVVI
jgi:hypothetical protein